MWSKSLDTRVRSALGRGTVDHTVDRIELQVLPLSRVDAESIARWRYPGAYAYYNAAEGRAAEAVSYMLDPYNDFNAVRGPRGLHGFCSFGPDGQVCGGAYDADALDIGAGMDPALVGDGSGRALSRRSSPTQRLT